MHPDGKSRVGKSPYGERLVPALSHVHRGPVDARPAGTRDPPLGFRTPLVAHTARECICALPSLSLPRPSMCGSRSQRHPDGQSSFGKSPYCERLVPALSHVQWGRRGYGCRGTSSCSWLGSHFKQHCDHDDHHPCVHEYARMYRPHRQMPFRLKCDSGSRSCGSVCIFIMASAPGQLLWTFPKGTVDSLANVFAPTVARNVEHLLMLFGNSAERRVTDIVQVTQRVGECTCRIEGDGFPQLAGFAGQCSPNRLVGWLHSHHSLQGVPSWIDVREHIDQQQLGSLEIMWNAAVDCECGCWIPRRPAAT